VNPPLKNRKGRRGFVVEGASVRVTLTGKDWESFTISVKASQPGQGGSGLLGHVFEGGTRGGNLS